LDDNHIGIIGYERGFVKTKEFITLLADLLLIVV